MNKQEIFDTVVNHLRTQGKPAIDDGGTCVYRSPEGLSCAVGCLITDDEYTEDMESLIASDLYHNDMLPKRLVPHLDFLSVLQVIHDGFDQIEWEKEFKGIASNHGLVYTPITKE